MKILILNDYAILQGGAERLTFGIRDEMKRLGHDARVFATRAGATHHTMADYECFGTTTPLRTLSQTANLFAFAQLRGVLEDFRPDIVHVRIFLTQLSPLILPLLRSVPAIYHAVWYRPICPTGTKFLPQGEVCHEDAGLACYRNGCLPLRHWVPLQLQRRMWNKWRSVFDAVVANSEALKKSLEEAGIAPIRVISNGVEDLGTAHTLEVPRLVGCAARLVPEKGVDVLIDAFAGVAREFPDVRLVIAGDGPERLALENRVQSLGIGARVNFLGQIAPSEMERRLKHAWVQVIPSLWEEPFGLVAAEAMMRGTSVIASKAGGLAEIVQDGVTGFLCEPGNKGALEDKLRYILQTPDLASLLGKAGRQRALAKFTIERQCHSFLNLYTELLNR